MYENIAGLTIDGRYFKAPTTLRLFEKQEQRISLIYGRNGSGKSTCAKGILISGKNTSATDLSATLFDYNSTILTPPSDGWPNMYLFDEDYIDQNVRINEDGLGTIVLLGDQVDVDTALNQLNERLYDVQTQKKTIEDNLKDYNNASHIKSPSYYRSKIEKKLKDDDGWAFIDSKIKGNTQKSRVNDSLVEELSQLSSKVSLSDLRNEFEAKHEMLKKSGDLSFELPNKIDSISFTDDFETKVIDLLAKKIEQPQLNVREKLILDAILEGKSWQIEEAKNVLSKEDTRICPYCYQEVSEAYKKELLNSISHVLNKDVETHKSELHKYKYQPISLNLLHYEAIDNNLSMQIDQQIQKCNSIVNEYNTLLENKSANVFMPLHHRELGLRCAVSELNRLIGIMDQKRIDLLDASKRRKDLEQELLSLNKIIASKVLQDDFVNYKKQSNEMLQLTKKYDQFGKDEKDIFSEISKLENQKSDVGIAIIKINKALQYIF